jgi:hypothetical protein
MPEKMCSGCKKVFDISFFHVMHSRGGRPSPRCKTCSKALRDDWKSRNGERQLFLQNRWKRENPERAAIHSWRVGIKRKYGLSENEYLGILAAQDYKCAACGVTAEENGRRLAVDHDHSTGNIRGILCDACNVAIGKFKDSLLILRAAIAYLVKHDSYKV